jgi:hypothetical protein
MIERKIESVWYEFEDRAEPHNENDDNSDVIFELNDGTKWVATFFTIQNIMSLCKKNKKTGECLNGIYFCSTDMIIVEQLNRELILKTLQDLIENDEIELYCSSVESTAL